MRKRIHNVVCYPVFYTASPKDCWPCPDGMRSSIRLDPELLKISSGLHFNRCEAEEEAPYLSFIPLFVACIFFFFFLLVRASVAEPHHFAADPDHDFHFDADPDPDHDFQFDADPDPTTYFSPDLDPPMPQNWHSISMRFLS